jgi:hypothetical protein
MREVFFITAKLDLTDLFELFGKTVEKPLVDLPVSPEARKWRRTFERHLATVMTVRGLRSDAAEKVAFENTVTEFLNATHPDTDPNRCAHCRRAETPGEVLLPIGVGPHSWLHSSCWAPWRERRKAEAINQLAKIGIERWTP